MLGLGAFSVWLVLVAVVGAITLGDDDSELTTSGGVTTTAPAVITPESGETTTTDSDASGTTGNAAGQNGTDGGSVAAPTGGADSGSSNQAAAPQQAAPAAPAVAGDRTGVSDSQIKFGVHAPTTFSGIPLDLAADPIKGVEAYIKFLNERDGGIHGRKMVMQLEDDRFDSTGARNAAQRLVNDCECFMVSGTLGIDQVAVVAAEAARRGVPYTAAGGSEEVPIPGMIQLGTSYTTHVQKLAEFIASDSRLKGKRIGILVSDSEFIKPVADTFKKELEARGQIVSVIVPNQKPQQNPDYNGYILRFRQENTEVVVPLTDPLTTQQIVQRCAAGAACGWTYSFSNFAHESDTALALMTPTWSSQRVRGLAGGCYYMAAEVDGNNCGAMKVARAQYVEIHDEDAWEEEGSGASAGYQIVSFLKGALRAPGADLTRERFRAALLDYANYTDLVSGPITHRGSGNTMHGSELMTVFEAQSDNTYKMITPGFVDGF